MKKLLFIPFLLMCFLGVYSRPRAVSLARDNIKVTVYPELCTFEIERKIPGTEKFVPVMSTIDPSTSTTTVRIGDKAYKVSDKKYFSSDLMGDENQVVLTYYYPEVLVTQIFTLVKSKNSGEFDGVNVTWRVRNLVEARVNVALRFIFDSNLGEGLGVHFSTDGHPRISSETEISGDYLDSYVLTKGRDSTLGILFKVNGFDSPERVIFANWKRLNSAYWDFTTEPGRNFSYMPYSVNDSAVAFYWPSKILEPNEEYKAALVFTGSGIETYGQSEPAENPAPVETGEVKTSVDAPVPVQGVNPGPVSVQSSQESYVDYTAMTVEEIIERLDYLLDNPQEARNSELIELEAYLNILEQRK